MIPCTRPQRRLTVPEWGRTKYVGLTEGAAMNPIDLVTQDHRTVEELFVRWNEGPSPEIAEEIKAELELHTKMEEDALYPVISRYVDGGDDIVAEARDEHAQVKEVLGRIGDSRSAEDLEPDMRRIIQLVTHHVREEEQEVLPQLVESLPEETLAQLTERLTEARSRAVGGAGSGDAED